ncbi:MAG TPA: phosphate/phosphite/phosphonate ABC transporter substrate-binding protein [Paracoccaceae bacterium]|nr:phosphate/phosphite/phosphonate ABC transporter substrate-binding protein [Paracoccaceae bacterium]
MRQCIDSGRGIGRRAFLASAALAALGASLGRAGSARELVLAFIPQENPEKLLGDIEVISAYLSRETGLSVRGFVTSDHAAAIEALRNGDADISFMGALPFVIAEREVGAEVVLAEVYRGSPTYTGRVFVRKDSGIRSLADLRGRSIAFADPISESGYLYPLQTFVEAGLMAPGDDPKSFFGEVFFAGGYQQAMQAMATGLVDAAGASQYAELLLAPEDQAVITWIAESEPIPSHVVIARKGLDPEIKARFAASMLKLNEPANRGLLAHVYSPDGYVRAEASMFDGVRRLAAAHGLLR